MAFYLEKPEGFDFIAGQYMTVSLFNPPETDDEGDSRFLSIASAPYEKYLMVATRIRDTAFKRVLKNLLVGSEIKIAGPDGSFYLPQKSFRPVVFLIGGIGITPVFSIIKNKPLTKNSHINYFVLLQQKAGRRGVLKRIAKFRKRKPEFQTCRYHDGSGASPRPKRRGKFKNAMARRNRIYN